MGHRCDVRLRGRGGHDRRIAHQLSDVAADPGRVTRRCRPDRQSLLGWCDGRGEIVVGDRADTRAGGDRGVGRRRQDHVEGLADRPGVTGIPLQGALQAGVGEADQAGTDRAIEALDGKEFDDRKMSVRMAETKNVVNQPVSGGIRGKRPRKSR